MIREYVRPIPSRLCSALTLCRRGSGPADRSRRSSNPR